jgi:hypothetical protein
MGIFIIALTVIFVVGLYYYEKYNRRFQHLPGPKGLPFLGNAGLFFGKTSVQIYNVLSKLSKQFDSIIKLSIGPLNKIILLQDPKDIEFMLSSQKFITKGDEYFAAKVKLKL